MAELEIKPTAGSRARVALVLGTAAGITGILVFLLSGGGRDFFSAKAALTTFMPDVTGLARNAEVRFGGIQIGKVTQVEITGFPDPQRAVRVAMKVTARFMESIPRDSITSIGADTLVGYKFLDIAKGKSPLLVAENAVLPSEPLKQASDRADLIKTFQTELRQVDEILIQVSSKDTKIGHYVMGEQEYNNLLKQVSSFDSTIRSFVGPESMMGDALFTERIYKQFREPLLRIDENLAAIQRGEGPNGRLFASDAQYNDFVQRLRAMRASLADANAGKGQFGGLLTDDAAYRKISAMLASTDALLDSLGAGEGSFGDLLKSPQAYESLNGSLRNMQEFLKDFRGNPRKYLRYKVF